ncbi:type 1 fimbrial protein [Serratia marcescens]|uniref:Type 1 fimbrial protein n=1 Tax=Serratia marcescens TaxID=615 RepID=A0A939NM55_SERMA|nr:type 1 fimbrial protein [Serratia marcescens]
MTTITKAAAADGTINFTGNVTDQTCTVVPAAPTKPFRWATSAPKHLKVLAIPPCRQSSVLL